MNLPSLLSEVIAYHFPSNSCLLLYVLAQQSLKLRNHKYTGRLVNTNCWAHPQSNDGFKSSQVMLMLLVCRPHFEKHWSHVLCPENATVPSIPEMLTPRLCSQHLIQVLANFCSQNWLFLPCYPVTISSICFYIVLIPLRVALYLPICTMNSSQGREHAPVHLCNIRVLCVAQVTEFTKSSLLE